MSGCRLGGIPGDVEDMLAHAANDPDVANGSYPWSAAGVLDARGGIRDRKALLLRLVLSLIRTDPPVVTSWGDLTLPADAGDLRVYLDYLLTTRPPGPLPIAAARDLDLLLATEAAARGAEDALSLPNLAATHGVPGALGQRVALWRGELSRLRADAVLNAANARMLGCFVPGHRCVDNMLHSAAGPGLRAECARYMADAEAADPARRSTGEPSGRAVLTNGYHLPALYVIHSVGPMAEDNRPPNREDRYLLSSCYTSALDLADRLGMNSLGLCSISTGAFGYPKPWAAAVAFDALAQWMADHPYSRLRVVIALASEAEYAAFEGTLAPAP
ncbi:macro domain-containing protein [Actinomyces capricornis]|uniref:Macro domain-containing protein n=1 Tax=Actinomyces capricornis TaxID=2755559 RepID=A0ABM7UAU2_9ACTO|nr:macro domain-containing protein [Actinomyces capricornis]BDA64430.1 hypothetical protein MANAM107_12640 [Actinomyces capricornis]